MKVENITKENLFIEMYRFNKIFNEIIEKSCKQYGINQVQLYILGLAIGANKTTSDLAKDLNLTKSAISQAICGLMIKRLVARRQSIEDKKMFYIVPTPMAEKLTNEILSACRKKHEKIEEIMGKENLKDFVELLNKFNQCAIDDM